ncbi:MAG: universal stress protein [Paludibacter sp.]|nr:universal stress protein [Paludibacter sp.]
MIKDKIKRVLIALDYDSTTLNVAEVGFNMAKTMGAEVIMLHVIQDLVTYSLSYLKMGSLKLKSVSDLKVAAQDFMDKPKKSYRDNLIQNIVKQGDFAESLLQTAKAMAVDMIVIGSHSSMWLEEIVMGRITNEMLQQTRIPILIIPTNKSEKLYTYISLEY